MNDKRTKREGLENRLINFAIDINKIVCKLPNTYLGKIISSQITRSSTSLALNYGEDQDAESNKDFIHKMHICLKELRETYVSIKIIERAEIIEDFTAVLKVKTEANELISIFIASINTAKRHK